MICGVDVCRKQFKYHDAFDHANDAIRVLKGHSTHVAKKRRRKGVEYQYISSKISEGKISDGY